MSVAARLKRLEKEILPSEPDGDECPRCGQSSFADRDTFRLRSQQLPVDEMIRLALDMGHKHNKFCLVCDRFVSWGTWTQWEIAELHDRAEELKELPFGELLKRQRESFGVSEEEFCRLEGMPLEDYHAYLADPTLTPDKLR